MREIKFDYILKDVLTSEIHHLKYFLEDVERGAISNLCNNKYVNILARRRFTGLLDKQGIEIYEGDIVCALVGLEVFTGVCEYIDKGAAFAISNNDELEWIHEYFDSQIEVIGNIHEHGVLLENKLDVRV